MDKIYPRLRDEYEYWLRQIGEDNFSGPKIIGPNDVLRAHYLLVDYFLREGEAIAASGPKSIHLMLSAIGRQTAGYGGVLKWNDDLEVCATLFFGLVKNHPFVDGNKRTGFLISIYQLLKIGRTPDAPQKEFESLAVKTAASQLSEYPGFSKFKKKPDPEVRFIADFFRRKTRKIDKSLYTITYRQLETILNKYGYYFDNPYKNHIDIVTHKKVRSMFGLKKVDKKIKILQIGYPGHTRQVNYKALSCVIKETGLTPENGIDSQVLFKGADPLDALIDTYKGPLKRLRDK